LSDFQQSTVGGAERERYPVGGGGYYSASLVVEIHTATEEWTLIDL
jgi:hypothetical protein